MNSFFIRGLIVVVICLIIYFLVFFSSVCLKVVFPKLNPSKCPQNYTISNCKDTNDQDISCCKLKDTSEIGLDPSLNSYFDNLKNNCDKEEIKYSDGMHYNPNNGIDDVIKKELCKWAKEDSTDYTSFGIGETKKKKKLNMCFVPWDSITNGLDSENKPIC